MSTNSKRIAIVCAYCGSNNVSRDAFADWDVAAQRWELRTVYDQAHCHHCDGETRLKEVELAVTE